MDTEATFGLAAHEIALLAGGERAAVTVAVVALRLAGAVETGPGRTLCATGPEPEGLAPFTGTVLDCLREPLTVRELARDPDVRLAVSLTRIPLADAGLLRSPRLSPNRTARRRVAFLRERYPLPADGHGLADDDTLLAVALHGTEALRVLLPRFAVRAGLLTGPAAGPDAGRARRRGRFLRRAGALGDVTGHGDGGDGGGGGGGCGGD
ncbi:MULTISPECIES: TIGR04222 domain-containing membrane protein [Streptomyces]|uniref:TIGR04222 domain-containing membrane protein n=2 Tax=Streptomyces TaxID=1883 RepID=A0ABT9LMY8_STRGD|nr:MULTISPECIES: TIGR04222 domain-containing membrane protein [Streptomyces]MDP9684886.1 hypothetical protein [Streptomyces griseoviridis]GGT17407.1 hypothetical protein GCM10010240_58170 [Streptomyces griseoviridis]GGU46709.1 hypothetical protein GCM10010259_42050 [Streptomyces daghestanicus]GHI33638.1 hypothetical protein Sdagh_53680 [Streptomyces daghestanicus]